MRVLVFFAALLFIGLAVLLPFASTTPDGLEKVTANSGKQPVWKGLMGGYTVALGNSPYVSTLVAGLLGTAIILLSSYALGSVSAKKDKKRHQNSFNKPA